MKRKSFGLGLFILIVVLSSGSASCAETTPVIIADFDLGIKPNNVEGNFGAWNYDPNDATQYCRDFFDPHDALGDPLGYALQLDYDVQSPNPAFNGFWMELKSFDASPYESLTFWVRGKPNAFTKRFKVELKNKAGQRAVYHVANLDTNWQRIKIPFKGTKAISDWSQLELFVIVFDDILATMKEGTIYIDQIAFE